MEKFNGIFIHAGEEFEQKILSNEQGNAKFNFLKEGDPYNFYYRRQIEQFRSPEEKKDEQNLPSHPPPAQIAVPPPKPSFLPPVHTEAEPPEAEGYTLHVPDGITMADLELMKITAQFVARNGKSFLTGLISREKTNPRYNFLKPTHSLYKFFTKICDSYSKVLMPPKDVLIKLKKDEISKMQCLNRALRRLEFERARDKEEQERKDAEEAERMSMLSTDWHDFVIVETINFQDGEESTLPVPITLQDAMRLARDLQFQQQEPSKMDEEEAQMIADGQQAAVLRPHAQDVEMQLSDEDEPTTIKVVKNYKRQDFSSAGKTEYDPTKFVISPITGELVPLEDMAEHMRVSLIDPKWKTQKEAMLSKLKETSKASDDEISKNLSLLARTRPDVFGDNSKLGAAVEKEMKDKMNQSNLSIEPSMAPGGSKTDSVTPPSVPPPSVPPPSVPPPPENIPENTETEGTRREKVETVVLVDEDEWVRSHEGQIKVNILCPDVPGNDVLNGQAFFIEVTSVRNKVQDLKSSAANELNIPANKIRLARHGIGFLSDARSLAHYNIDSGTQVQLSLKGRGGVKRKANN